MMNAEARKLLPKVQLESFRHFAGRVTGAHSLPLPNPHILVMMEPRDLKNTVRAPDLREVASADGSLNLNVYGRHTYVAVAWAKGFEPALWKGSMSSSGLSTLRDLVLAPLQPSSFTSSARVLVPDLEASDARQFVRARPIHTGTAARAALYEWPGGAERSVREVMPTRYQVELIGIDRTPQTRGRKWQQILPGDRSPTASSGSIRC